MAPKKGIRWDDEPLGQESDYVIAARLKVTPRAVSAARKARGIPPLNPSFQAKGIDWDALPLGTVSDGELARALVGAGIKVSAKSVQSARRTRGIAPRWPSGGAFKKATGRGRNKAKRNAAQRLRRAEGRTLTPEQRRAKTEAQRRRRALPGAGEERRRKERERYHAKKAEKAKHKRIVDGLIPSGWDW